MNKIKNHNCINLFALLFLVNVVNAQVRQHASNIISIAPTSSAFFDASSTAANNNSLNLGKGMIFPRVNLVSFTSFSSNGPVGIPNNYPTFYDGFLVYNTSTSGSAGIGATEGGALSEGFWMYDNKSTTIGGGTWRPLVDSPEGLRRKIPIGIATGAGLGGTDNLLVINGSGQLQQVPASGLAAAGLGGSLLTATTTAAGAGTVGTATATTADAAATSAQGTNGGFVVGAAGGTGTKLVVNGNANVTGDFSIGGALRLPTGTGTSGQVLTSAGPGFAPTWGAGNNIYSTDGNLTGASGLTPVTNVPGNFRTITLGGTVASPNGLAINGLAGSSLLLQGPKLESWSSLILNANADNTTGVGVIEDIIFQVKDTEVARMKDGGNVGIGTNNPLARLDVAGKIKITDGSEGLNKVLTSDANGLATWTTPATAGMGSSLFTATTTAAGAGTVGTATATTANAAATSAQGTNGGFVVGAAGGTGTKLVVNGNGDITGDLSVGGALKLASGTGTAGQVLTSAGAGPATWSNPVNIYSANGTLVGAGGLTSVTGVTGNFRTLTLGAGNGLAIEGDASASLLLKGPKISNWADLVLNANADGGTTKGNEEIAFQIRGNEVGRIKDAGKLGAGGAADNLSSSMFELLRDGTTGIQNSISFGISGASRDASIITVGKIDLKVSGTSDGTNNFGKTPNVTALSLFGDGSVSTPGSLTVGGALNLSTGSGSLGQVLTSGGPNVAPTWSPAGGGKNIYDANGTLVGAGGLTSVTGVTGNFRTLTLGAGNGLAIVGDETASLLLQGPKLANWSNLVLNANADGGAARAGEDIVFQVRGNELGRIKDAGNLGAGGAADASINSIFELRRGSTSGVQNPTSFGISGGANTANINGVGRYDFKVSGNPVTANSFGNIPDITVMSLVGNGTNGQVSIPGSLTVGGALNLASGSGTAGQVLTSAGPGLAPTWGAGGGNNIYNSNGTLTSARTVTMGANKLVFSGSSTLELQGSTSISHLGGLTLSANSDAIGSGENLDFFVSQRRYMSLVDGGTLNVITNGGLQSSLKLEHNGSNFVVRPETTGGSNTVIENTAGQLLINSRPRFTNIPQITSPALVAVMDATGNMGYTATANIAGGDSRYRIFNIPRGGSGSTYDLDAFFDTFTPGGRPILVLIDGGNGLELPDNVGDWAGLEISFYVYGGAGENFRILSGSRFNASTLNNLVFPPGASYNGSTTITFQSGNRGRIIKFFCDGGNWWPDLGVR